VIEEFRLKNLLGPLDPLEPTTMLGSSAPLAGGNITPHSDGTTLASLAPMSFDTAIDLLRKKLTSEDFDSFFEVTPSGMLLLRLTDSGTRCIKISSSAHGFDEQHRLAYLVVRKATEERRSKDIAKAKQRLEAAKSAAPTSSGNKGSSSMKIRQSSSTSDTSSDKRKKGVEKAGRAEVEKAKAPDLPPVCKHFQAGDCRQGKACPYLHQSGPHDKSRGSPRPSNHHGSAHASAQAPTYVYYVNGPPGAAQLQEPGNQHSGMAHQQGPPHPAKEAKDQVRRERAFLAQRERDQHTFSEHIPSGPFPGGGPGGSYVSMSPFHGHNPMMHQMAPAHYPPGSFQY
jgi:hypothetical protein